MELLTTVFNNVKTMTVTLYLLVKPFVMGIYETFNEQKGGGRRRKMTRKRNRRVKRNRTRKRYRK